MPPSASLLRHPAAGRVDAVRTAVRFRGTSADGAATTARLAEGPLAAGAIRLGPAELVLAVDVGEDAVALDPVVRNAGDAPVLVDAVVLGFRWTPPDVRTLRYLRHGWQSWSFTGSRALDDAGERPFPSGTWLRGMFHALGSPPEDRAGWHESDLVTAIGHAAGGFACLAGVLERGATFGVVYARRDADAVEVEVELRLEALLRPGERRALETVRVALGADASPLLEEFATVHGRAAAARTRAPFQAGWCSWYHFFHDVTEEDVLRNLDALVSLRAEIPITLVQLDDGYQRAIGDWLDTNPKFPRGLAPLARDIRAAGFDAGLWTAPFCVAPDSAIFASRPEWVLRHAGEPFLGLLHPMWTKSARIFVLDASREDVCAHLVRVFRELTEMGFSYEKIDFLYAEAMEAEAFDTAVSRAERLRRALAAVRRGCGDETFILGCGCPLGPAAGIVDGMRIGPDVGPHWGILDDPPIPGLEPTRPSVRNGVRSIVNRAFLHRRLWLNDPDCLMARTRDTKLSPAEAHTLAAAIAGTGGMLLFSDDVPKLAPESRQLVAETLRLAREVDEAGEVGVAVVPGLLAAEIPDLVVARVPGGALLTCLDAGDAPSRRSLGEETLGVLPPDATIEGELGSTRRAAPPPVEVALAPHASEVLRLRTGPRVAVFCDFDGTFIDQDVGATLVRRHNDAQRAALEPRLLSGEITAWEYNQRVLEGLEVPEDALDAFLRSIALDPGATSLVSWCRERGVPFRILSDGFDRNVARLQELLGVRVPFDANRVRVEDGRFRLAPGAPDAACGCGTGLCKRARIEAHRRRHPGVLLVHVGNGRISDLCGALAADLAFAKGSLARVMEARGAPFVPFETLHDVVAHLEPRLAEVSR